MSNTKSLTANLNITPDPKADSFTIRKAFFAEAVANLSMIPLVTNTSWALTLILNHPSDVNPSSILFARLFGSIVIGGLTSALLAGCMNTRNGIESRRPTYLLLGIGEATLVPILVNEMLKNGGSEAAVSKKVAGICISILLPLLAWRFYVLVVSPDLFGKYREKRGGRDIGGYGAISSRDE